MRRQKALLLATMLGALVFVLAACGGGGSEASGGGETTGSGGSTTASGDPYNVSPSLTSLQGAGWQANETEGIPDT